MSIKEMMESEKNHHFQLSEYNRITNEHLKPLSKS